MTRGGSRNGRCDYRGKQPPEPECTSNAHDIFASNRALSVCPWPVKDELGASTTTRYPLGSGCTAMLHRHGVSVLPHSAATRLHHRSACLQSHMGECIHRGCASSFALRSTTRPLQDVANSNRKINHDIPTLTVSARQRRPVASSSRTWLPKSCPATGTQRQPPPVRRRTLSGSPWAMSRARAYGRTRRLERTWQLPRHLMDQAKTVSPLL